MGLKVSKDIYSQRTHPIHFPNFICNLREGLDEYVKSIVPTNPTVLLWLPINVYLMLL